MNLWRITGTFFSKLLTVALVMMVLCTMSQADAAKKEKPQVIWSPNIFSLQKDDMLLNYPGVKDKIIHAINRKLTELEQKDKLPFTLKTNSEASSLNDIYVGNDVALIPLVVMDSTFDRTFHSVNGNTYYATCINSGLCLMLCSMEENTDPSMEANVSFRMLGMIPLYTQTWLGNPKVEKIDKPIKDSVKAAAFAQITADTVQRYLDFKSQKKILKNLEEKLTTDETYQVTDVRISSKKAAALFADSQQDLDMLKSTTAYFFTGAYQQNSKKILLPPNVAASSNVSEDVVDNISSLHIDSNIGDTNLLLPQARNKITLDITGFNFGEVHDKTANELVKNTIYKGWLAHSGIDGKPQVELSTELLVKTVRNDESAVEMSEKDLCMDLMTALAQDLGNKK